MKWKKIDELEIEKRAFLREGDQVYYLREYTSHAGYDYSGTNNDIGNLKKGANCSNPEKYYRNQAIQKFAYHLKCLLDGINKKCAIVGMPSRHAKQDPEYDDRLDQVVSTAIQNLPEITQSNIIENVESREMVRGQTTRDPNFIKKYLTINQVDLEGITDLVIVDDVLTSGCTIRAVTEKFQEVYPDLNLWFVCWAKVIWT